TWHSRTTKLILLAAATLPRQLDRLPSRGLRTPMRLSVLTRVEGNARRLTEIVSVLSRYGLADWLAGLNYEWLQGRLVSCNGERLGKLTHEARIRLALTELGTTFIKLGQILSTRPDLVGPELADELGQLRSNTPPD